MADAITPPPGYKLIGDAGGVTPPLGYTLISNPPSGSYSEKQRGAKMKGTPVTPAPFQPMESGVNDVAAGVQQMNEGGNDRSWWNPIPSSKELGGMSKVVRGTGKIVFPLAVAANPVGSLVGAAAGIPVGLAVEAGSKALGVPEGTSEFMGDVAGAATGGLAAHGARRLVSGAPPNPEVKMVKAMKPTSTNTGFKESLSRSLPELKATEAETGQRITNLAELMDAINTAKKRVWEQYRSIAEQPAIDPYSGKPTVGTRADVQHDMSSVADAIEATISPKLIRESPKAVLSIKSLAKKYRTSMTLQEAESILKTTNSELDGYYAKYPSGQRRTLASNPKVAVKEAQASALRDRIYTALDDAGEGAAPREFKQRYGALMNLEREGYRRINVAERQQPDSLSQQAGKWVGFGHMVKGVLTQNLSDVAMGIAESKASTWLKNQQTTDALIRSALANYKSMPTAVASPPQFRPKALLTQGDIITPPPSDTSGTISSRPNQMETRAMVQPRLLAPPEAGQPPLNVLPRGPASVQGPSYMPSTAGNPIPLPRARFDTLNKVLGGGAINPETGKPFTPQEIAGLSKFAKGGIIKRPTHLVDVKSGKVTGLMAEAGPEAIVPLASPDPIPVHNAIHQLSGRFRIKFPQHRKGGR